MSEKKSDLQQLLNMQRFLNNVTMEKRELPSVEEIESTPQLQEEWALQYIRAMKQELSEAIDNTNWKWWKDKSVDRFDLQNIRIELIDVLHFWLSACTAVGMAAEDVMRIYLAKNQVNLERQDKGYAGKNTGDDSHIQ